MNILINRILRWGDRNRITFNRNTRGDRLFIVLFCVWIVIILTQVVLVILIALK